MFEDAKIALQMAVRLSALGAGRILILRKILFLFMVLISVRG
jgi:hypothetical protein